MEGSRQAQKLRPILFLRGGGEGRRSLEKWFPSPKAMKHLYSCSTRKAVQTKNFISKRLKRAILVLPLVGMH